MDLKKWIGGLFLAGAALSSTEIRNAYEEGRARYAAEYVYDDMAPAEAVVRLAANEAPPEIWESNKVTETAPAEIIETESPYPDFNVSRLQEELRVTKVEVQKCKDKISEILAWARSTHTRIGELEQAKKAQSAPRAQSSVQPKREFNVLEPGQALQYQGGNPPTIVIPSHQQPIPYKQFPSYSNVDRFCVGPL